MRRPPHANGNKNIVPLLCALCYFLIAISGLPAVRAKGQAQATLATRNNAAPQSVIIDTDIGGDIDDVYAVALALHSPELRILGIMTEFVDTTLEARLASRFLKETGYSDIPVAVGTPKQLAAIVRRLVAEDEIDCDARCSDDLTEESR
jgi:hypothetical protein